MIDALLDHQPEDWLRTAGRLLRLAERFGKARLEAACARALQFDDGSYVTVKRILEQALDLVPVPAAQPAVSARIFARSAQELLGHAAGGESWN